VRTFKLCAVTAKQVHQFISMTMFGLLQADLFGTHLNLRFAEPSSRHPQLYLSGKAADAAGPMVNHAIVLVSFGEGRHYIQKRARSGRLGQVEVNVLLSCSGV
jgi:hypothetical protein